MYTSKLSEFQEKTLKIISDQEEIKGLLNKFGVESPKPYTRLALSLDDSGDILWMYGSIGKANWDLLACE